MFVEKEANPTSGELAFGFRFAARYGVDGPDTQGFGHPGPTRDLEPDYTRGGKYDWALPLLYGELARGELARGELARWYRTLLWLDGLRIRSCSQNFVYSHSMMMYNREPFPHTGAVATCEIRACTTLHGG